MFDVIRAVSGKTRCDWCVHKDTTWWESFTDQDQLGNSPVLWKRTAVRIQLWFGDHVPLWKAGKWWHHRYHIASDDYRKVKGAWCDRRQVGDVVCDCRGFHLKIAKFRDGDSVLLEDGMACSLYHCCSEPDPDNKCHHGIPLDETQDL